MHDHDIEHEAIDPRIAAAADEGCEESRQFMSRRAFMGVSAGLCAWAFLPRSASAAGNVDSEKRLLIVLLQGGMDGLHVAPPIGDPKYVSRRGALAQDPAKQKNLDGFFYLHPSMPNFYKAYTEGQATIIHSIAPPLRIRSHFECMYNLESGYPGVKIRSAKSGWMNRLLSHIPRGEDVMSKGLQMGESPLILTGSEPVLSWTRWDFPRPAWYTDRLQLAYDKTDRDLSPLLRDGIRIRNLALSSSDGQKALDQAFHGAGNLMAAPNGPRIAALTVGGWDTHDSLVGTLSARLAALDLALQEFRSALGETAWANTVVACVSEMGRTAIHNGSKGSDHGVGTAALLMGGAVAGRKVIADWPGLEKLEDNRDLLATTCTRALFKGILLDHLKIDPKILEADIFPESAAVRPMRGLVRVS
jgi:uncharacterized protein (DUF1501 family)